MEIELVYLLPLLFLENFCLRHDEAEYSLVVTAVS